MFVWGVPPSPTKATVRELSSIHLFFISWFLSSIHIWLRQQTIRRTLLCEVHLMTLHTLRSFIYDIICAGASVNLMAKNRAS